MSDKNKDNMNMTEEEKETQRKANEEARKEAEERRKKSQEEANTDMMSIFVRELSYGLN